MGCMTAPAAPVGTQDLGHLDRPGDASQRQRPERLVTATSATGSHALGDEDLPGPAGPPSRAARLVTVPIAA